MDNAAKSNPDLQGAVLNLAEFCMKYLLSLFAVQSVKKVIQKSVPQ